MNEPNIVILAAGISSRMKRSQEQSPLLDSALLRDAREKPKAMLGIGSDAKPFLDYVLKSIERAGYRNVVIVVGERDHSIREYYETKGGAQAFSALAISYAVQNIPQGRTKPTGTADALLAALRSKPEWEGESFTVCNSDNLYSVEAFRLLLEDTHLNAMIDYDRSALAFEQTRIAQFAVIKKTSDGFLTDIIEKPAEEEILKYADSQGRIGVSMNIFRLSYQMILPVLETLPFHSIRQEKELPVAVKMLVIQSPKSVWTIPRSEHVPDLTNQSDIQIVKEYLQGMAGN